MGIRKWDEGEEINDGDKGEEWMIGCVTMWKRKKI